METIARTIERTRTFRSGILRKRLSAPLFRRSLRDVKRVVIINSSSRSGSSLLSALLGKLPGIYSLSGEAAPFYKLNTTLDGFSLFESDKIPPALLDRVIDEEGLARDFFSDLNLAGDEGATRDVDLGEYADSLMLRLSLQWAELDLDPAVLGACITRAFERYAARSRQFRTEDFYLDLLEELVAAYPQINPFYYDLSTEKVALRFPSTEIPAGSPNSCYNIEEPPFILLPPRRRISPADLAERTLLLKSTVDCYRMNLIEKIFPAADIRIIHLVRNPAATTNGIYDGWLHRGFFSHNLQPFFHGTGGVGELRIKGYSDVYPFGRRWWNFDLPEDWQRFADRDLVEVCAFQWYSANAEIDKYLSGSRRKSIRVRFEDIVRGFDSRAREFERMLDFMGVPAEQAALLGLGDLPVVQATLPPQLYRWKRRKDLIARVLDDALVRDMTGRLGYRTERMEEWL